MLRIIPVGNQSDIIEIVQIWAVFGTKIHFFLHILNKIIHHHFKLENDNLIHSVIIKLKTQISGIFYKVKLRTVDCSGHTCAMYQI